MMIYLNYLWVSKFVKSFSECNCIMCYKMIDNYHEITIIDCKYIFINFCINMRRIWLKLEKFRIKPKIVK